MTVLHRTHLLPKIQCAAAALARQHHGSKTLSEAYASLALRRGARPRRCFEQVAAPLRPVARGCGGDGADDAKFCRNLVALRVMAPNALRPIGSSRCLSGPRCRTGSPPQQLLARGE